MYLIRNISIKVNSKNNPEEKPVNFLRSLRITCSRSKIKINYDETNIVHRYCTMCKNQVDPSEYTFKFKKIDNNIYEMYFVGHPNDKEYAYWSICKDCKKIYQN